MRSAEERERAGDLEHGARGRRTHGADQTQEARQPDDGARVALDLEPHAARPREQALRDREVDPSREVRCAHGRVERDEAPLQRQICEEERLDLGGRDPQTPRGSFDGLLPRRGARARQERGLSHGPRRHGRDDGGAREPIEHATRRAEARRRRRRNERDGEELVELAQRTTLEALVGGEERRQPGVIGRAEPARPQLSGRDHRDRARTPSARARWRSWRFSLVPLVTSS